MYAFGIDWTQLLTLLAINGVGALGFYVTMASGQLSIGHGALYTVGGYAAGYTAVTWGVPVPGLFLIAFVAAGLVGYVFGLVLVRLRGMYFAVATFALGSAIAEAIIHVDAIGGPYGFGGIPLFTSLPLALGTLLVCAFAVRRWDRSSLYQVAALTRLDQDAAIVLGIDVRRARRAGFALGAGIAGVAGVLYVGSTSIIAPEQAGFQQSLAFLLMVVIGGARSWRGPLLGAAVWTLLPEVLRFADTWRWVIFGAIAVVLMAVRPEGMLDRRIPGRGRWWSARRASGATGEDATPTEPGHESEVRA